MDLVGVIPVACTMTNLAVKTGGNLEPGLTVTFSLRKGPSLAGLAATALSCGVTSVATFCSDTDAVPMSAGDVFLLRVQYNDGSTGSGDIFITDLVCQ